jgi:predicted nucleic acid-binding protein
LRETLVVDCSVAAKWVLHEAGHIRALDLLQEERAGKVALIAPDLLLAEFASLIAKRTRRKQISLDLAEHSFRLMQQSAPMLFATQPLLEAALKLALDHQLSLWDCVYLALAIAVGCPMITADRRLFRSGVSRHPAIRLLN